MGALVFSLESLDDLFFQLRLLRRRYGVNAFTIEYRSSLIKGLPKLDYHSFFSSYDLSSIRSIIAYGMMVPELYRIEQIEPIEIAGKLRSVARIRAVYPNPS